MPAYTCVHSVPPLTPEEIAKAFEGTNFGRTDYTTLLEQGVLKTIAGYSSGHTLTTIMRELGLVTPKGYITRKGRALLFHAFYDARKSG